MLSYAKKNTKKNQPSTWALFTAERFFLQKTGGCYDIALASGNVGFHDHTTSEFFKFLEIKNFTRSQQIWNRVIF